MSSITKQLVSRACSSPTTLSKEAFLGQLSDGSKQKSFFQSIPYDTWQVISFNPNTRVVCVTIVNGKTTNTISVTLQVTTNSQL